MQQENPTNAEEEPKTKDKPDWVTIVERIVSGAAVLGAVIMIVIKNPTWHMYVLAIWVVLAPVWFMFESLKYRPEPTTKFERFKHDQELARNLWLGIGVLLLALYKTP